jgi:hypothetical protein
LIFDKGTKNIQQRKDSLFNKCQENWMSACRHPVFLKLNPSLSFCTSINARWIKDFNMRFKSLKLVQERTLELLGITNELKWLSN